jgi:hypothetical protein
MLITLARLFMKLLLVWSTATSMGWLGLYLMYWGTPVHPMLGEFWTNYVVVASIVVWSAASIMLGNHNRLGWLIFGLISPLFGALLVAPPASFAFVIAKGYIAFPIGVVTGFLMVCLSRIKFPRKLLKSQHNPASA